MQIPIKVKNYFYLPDSGINGNGTFTANFDKKHNYVEEASTIINRLPIEFTNTITTLSGVNTAEDTDLKTMYLILIV